MLSASFLDFIETESLFKKNDHLLLAISGGLDSVVLAHLLKINGYQFSLAHMNFQLRGNDSDLDEEFVIHLAKKLDVEIYLKKVLISGKGSTQIQARKLRYDWFKDLMEKYSFSKLCTAHHANDLLETALINLSRGTGIKGLRSILPSNGILVRPLLFAEKNELKQFAEEHLIDWREDVSNASDFYIRNKIRHHVIPQLQSINPNLISGFKQTAQRLRASEDAWKEKLNLISDKYFKFEESSIKIKKSLLQLPYSIIYMSELLSEHGFGMPQLQSFDFTRVGAQLFAQEYVLSVDRDFIFVNKKENETIISFFPLKLTLEKDFISTPYGVFEWEFIQAQDVEYNRQPHIAFIDFEKLMEPLILDRWQEGDKIQPLGMKGRKKISDILIDQKVPVQQKKQAIVLKSNNEIVWLVGYKFSEVFKVDDNSRKILRIAYYENNESI